MTLGDKCMAILRKGGEITTSDLARMIWPDTTEYDLTIRRGQLDSALRTLEKYGFITHRVETHIHAYANHVAYWRALEAEA